ncbi:MAG: tetratricopeptide repeat protein [Planctomycetes bacterium]|nr:tetratricopeptide repeat protein [Planctomycetota bacterium]HPY74172.1 tetratricopeptide repeat protein [Planctomycetota bacterium]HQA99785.1 tetratricopeptide repeat protein [Planctomycetota bacterium]
MVLIFIVLLCCMSNLFGLEYTWTEEGFVQARDNGVLVWERQHAIDYVNFNKIYFALVGEDLYYNVLRTLYCVESRSGKVKDVWWLPGNCRSLKPSEYGVHVEVFSNVQDLKWKKTFYFQAGESKQSLFCIATLYDIMDYRKQALSVLEDILDKHELYVPKSIQEYKHREMQPFLEEAIVLLEKQDSSTNLCIDGFRCFYLGLLDRMDEAEAVFQKIINNDSMFQWQLMGLVPWLDVLSRDWGNQAFEKVMKFYLQHGYEPEDCYTILTFLVPYGRVREEIQEENILSYANIMGERLWDFAPFIECSASVYNHLAGLHKEAGNIEQEELWKQRTEQAMKHVYMGYPISLLEIGSHAMTLYFAFIFAFLIYLLVQGFRYFPFWVKSPWKSWKRWNLLFFWSKIEVIGLMILLCIGVVSHHYTYKGLQIFLGLQSCPVTVMDGFVGNPDQIEIFSCLSDSDFVKGYIFHRAGEIKEATAIYENIELEGAFNNLGVIEYQKGDKAKALEYFQKALALNPDCTIAQFNINQQGKDDRIERFQKYGVAGPYLVTPSVQEWDESISFIAQDRNIVSFTVPLADMFQWIGLPISEQHLNSIVFLKFLFDCFCVYIFICAIFNLFNFKKQKTETTDSFSISKIMNHILSYIFPGTHSLYKFLGPCILLLFFFTSFISRLYQLNQGFSVDIYSYIYSYILTPNFQQIFGIGERFSTPWATMLISIKDLVGWIFLFNVLFILSLDFFKNKETKVN